MQRIVALAVVAIAALLLAAGCGSDSSETSATDDWASSLCTAALDWRNAITSSVDSLRGGNLNEESLRTAGDDVKSATETFVDDVKGLGKPDTESGQKAKDAIDGLADQLGEDVDKIETALDDASSGGPVLNAISTVSATLATMATQVDSTLDELKRIDAQGELKSAFDRSDSCQELSKTRTA